MDTDIPCPVCYYKNWEIVGSRIYKKRRTSHLTEYHKIRYEVLFNVWEKNREEVEFSSILCRQCGFVAFLPRPTKEDIDRKYLYLSDHTSAKDELTVALPSDNLRSSELYEYMASSLKEKSANILDFGGGNGRLMPAFVREGHACYVVDYIDDALPGVEHLGSTIDDIPNDRLFDLIICSHVMEHLVEPRNIVAQLVRHLGQDGILYVEVPLEIWNEVPLPIEPVTHINFFTPQSMRALLELSGLDVMSCLEGMYTTEQGGRAFAIRAVARRAEDKHDASPDYQRNAAEAKALINPSISVKARRFLKYPDYRRKVNKRWAEAHLPRTFFWRFFN